MLTFLMKIYQLCLYRNTQAFISSAATASSRPYFRHNGFLSDPWICQTLPALGVSALSFPLTQAASWKAWLFLLPQVSVNCRLGEFFPVLAAPVAAPALPSHPSLFSPQHLTLPGVFSLSLSFFVYLFTVCSLHRNVRFMREKTLPLCSLSYPRVPSTQ